MFRAAKLLSGNSLSQAFFTLLSLVALNVPSPCIIAFSMRDNSFYLVAKQGVDSSQQVCL